ncbi:MAG: 3-hydroxyacyl-CoA dehydrogenase family protein [Candidatus Dormibacteraeota bacterium]|uniref:3-hydroxyacyl-CoA dehydrogenase family protein n=1 Tax=Candidatus Amunia macphersoniae TaxID=3127014 RepID=A0A934NGG0_9BACT|nr:3-hydroxyacyl-CoA dehydrogenase family protein [Candidatus Dormibacteraeota bacterium]
MEGTLCVVGAGAMGAQIAHQAALHGMPVRLYSRSQVRLDAATELCSTLLRKRVEKGKLASAECEDALGRVVTTTDLNSAAVGATVIIESVAEDRDTKRHILEAVGECADTEAVIGTNSSTLPSSLFADVMPNPGRLLNVHFMNPALVMPLVEVVRGAHTAPVTVSTAMDFARSIGKSPVLVERESFGFVANRILFIAMQEAFSLVESGDVSIDDCDLAVRNGLGWPMGPFALADLIGLDVVQAILEEGHRQTGEERWAPLTLLRDRVERGELGRKNGRGFTVPD